MFYQIDKVSRHLNLPIPVQVGKAGYAAVGAASFVAAAAFLATALRFFCFAFLPVDFNFRVRIAFFCIEVLFVGMVTPLAIHCDILTNCGDGVLLACSYNTPSRQLGV